MSAIKKILSSLTLEQILRCFIVAVSIWYVFLCLAAYVYQRPMWNDEICVMRSVTTFNAKQMFNEPLSSLQVFPRVYLFFIQQFSKLFDFHLLALRFFPFVCMLSAFFVWIYLAKKQIASLMGLLTFVLCWAASVPLIYYAAELKQYSMDVLVSGICLLCLYRGFNLVWYALPLVLFISYPSLFWMPLLGWNLIQYGRSTGKWHPLAIFTSIGLAVAGTVYCIDIRNTDKIAQYWQDYFISFSSVGEFFKTLGEGINNLISRWFAEKPKWIRAASRIFIGLGFLQMLISFFTRFKKEGFRFTSVHSVAFVVFIEMLILAVLKKYPFTVPRTSLYFAPVLLCLTTVALMNIKVKWPVVYRILHSVFLVYLLYVSVGIARCILSGDLGAQSVLWQ